MADFGVSRRTDGRPLGLEMLPLNGTLALVLLLSIRLAVAVAEVALDWGLGNIGAEKG